jgi:hypothetical protein
MARQYISRSDIAYFVGLILVIASSAVFPSPLVLAGLLFFPSIFFVRITKENWLTAVVVTPLFNVLLLVATTALLSALRIPITSISYLLFALICVGVRLGLQKYKEFTKFDLPQLDLTATLFVYFGFGLALVARVVSTRGVQAPMLHDPIAHAFWAQSILDNKSIEYFYSPGLHQLIAFVSENSNLTIPMSTHYVTVLLNALSVLTWPLLALYITRSKLFTIFLTTAMVIVPIPADLYFIAGKNSFIAAIAFVPFLFLFTFMFAKSPSVRNGIALVVATSALMLFHYPTAGYFVAYSALVLAGTLFAARKDKTKLVSLLKVVGISLAAFMALMGTWYLYVKKFRELEVQGLVPVVEPDGPSKIERLTDPDKYIQYTKSTIRSIQIFSIRYSNHYFTLGLASLLAIPFLFKRRDVLFHIFLLSACSYALMVFLRVFTSSSGTPVLVSTGYMIAFLLFALSISAVASFTFSKADLSKIALWILIGLLGITSLGYSVSQYRQYRAVSISDSAVTKDDVAAFRWMKKNIDRDEVILNNAIKTTSKTTIFSSDGAGWIPVYTKNELAIPFHNGLGRIRTAKNYALYESIEKDPELAICRILDKGIDFYYHDLQTPYPAALNVVELLPEENLTKVFSNDSVAIYRLNDEGLDCPSDS